MALTINIITRGRPELLRQTITHTLPNIARDDTTLMVSVDEDDEPTLDSIKMLPKDLRLHISCKPREDSRGEKYDRALTEAPAGVYLLAVDSTPILTPDFDQMIVNAANNFADGIGCVYTPMANASFPGYQAPTAKLVELIGYTYSHEYPYWFIDHELDDICRMIGRFAFVDVRTNPNATRPAKTIRLRDLRWWMDYFDAGMTTRREIARRIIDSPDFDEPEWRKAMLRSQYPVTESRSLFLHHQMRPQAENIEKLRGTGGEPDEGYLRIFEKARQRLKEMNRQTAIVAAAA